MAVSNVLQTAQFTYEDTTWEFRAGDTERVRDAAFVSWEVERLTGSTDLGYYVIMDAGGEQVASDNRQNSAFKIPDEGDLVGDVGGASAVSLRVEVDNDARTVLGDVSVSLPGGSGFDVVDKDSATEIPTWAVPPGEGVEITAQGEPEDWTEMVIESVSATPIEGGAAYEVTVSSEAVSGPPQTISRTLNIRRDYDDRREPVNASRTGGWDEMEVSIEPGGRKTVTGELSFNGTHDVRAYVKPKYDPGVKTRWGERYYSPAPTVSVWDSPPQETVTVPYPASDRVVKLVNRSNGLYRWATDGPIDGLTYRRDDRGSPGAVSEFNYIAAVLSYINGGLSDARMALIAAAYEEGGRSGGLLSDQPVLIGAVDEYPQGVVISIAGTQSGTQPPDHAPVYGGGLGLDFNDDFENAVNVSGTESVLINDLVPGETYTFGYSDVGGGVGLQTRGESPNVTPLPTPEPDPDPDPDPVEPPLNVACDFSDAEITPGGSVTVPADVTAGDGTTETNGTVVIEVAGEQATETVTLAPNASARVEATFAIDEPGEYQPTVALQ